MNFEELVKEEGLSEETQRAARYRHLNNTALYVSESLLSCPSLCLVQPRCCVFCGVISVQFKSSLTQVNIEFCCGFIFLS